MRLLTDAILTQLESGSRRIGDGQAPANNDRPYAVLYPLFAVDFDGPLGLPDVDAWYRYQVTSVGDTREQAQGLADELLVTMRAKDKYTWTGFVAKPVLVEDVLPVERDDAIAPSIFYQSFTVRIFVTPT